MSTHACCSPDEARGAFLGDEIRRELRGRVCYLGLGNVEYGDDGFGVILAERLAAAGVPDVLVAGTTPERHIGPASARGFDAVVFLDAVDFGGEPGSVVWLRGEEIAARFPQVSTHKFPLALLAKCVEASGRARAWLLGVQPESVGFGRRLTRPVQASLAALCELLLPPAEVNR